MFLISSWLSFLGWVSNRWVTNPLLHLEKSLPPVLGGIWHVLQLWFSNHAIVQKKEEKYWILQIIFL